MNALVVATLLISSTSCLAAPDKVAYELQERCGKEVSSEFKREFGTGTSKTKDDSTITGYRNHFNSRLNACMYLQSTTSFAKGPGGKQSSSVMHRLFDYNENREIGMYFRRNEDSRPFHCKVDGKLCTSTEEWEVLIKPYMEE